MNTPSKGAVSRSLFLLLIIVLGLGFQQVIALGKLPAPYGKPITPAHSDGASAIRLDSDSKNIEWISQIGGNIGAVAIQGHYAYAGETDQLAIFDITDPAAPDVVSRTPALVGGIVDVDVVGDYAYVLGGAAFRVIDVSDPVDPILKGSLEFLTSPQAIDVNGSHAYVIGLIGLDIIDVSNPANPTAAGHFSTDMESFDITVVGHYAYVAHSFVYSSLRSGGMEIIDVSDPTVPKKIGGYGSEDLAFSVAVDGNYAYLATLVGLKVINIADPTSAKLVGTFAHTTPFGHPGLAVSGKYVYDTSNGNGLRIIDVSSPTSPIEAGWYSLDIPEGSKGVAVAGGFAFVANGPGGMVILRYTGDDWTFNSFSPTWGPVGTAVVLTGTNFSGASAVRFIGVAATSFTIVSDTQIRAVVPDGATTGKITVFTPVGAAISSAGFVVTGIDTTAFIPVTMK